MMSKLERAAIAIGSILFPAAAQAHPGPHREELGASLFHALSQPDHLATMAMVLAWAAMVAAAWGITLRGAKPRRG